ncbi:MULTISPECIES: hypothetical protein [Photorhabdus]|nr:MULTISPECIES: hypothetical protein [Photorhabdus]NDL50969.1 hypothetical protein [Photorhabdus laumondii subsp. laumondii]
MHIPYGFQDGSRRQGSESQEHGKLCDRGVGKCSQQRGNLKDDGYK